MIPQYFLTGATFRDAFAYRNAAGAGVTGKVQADFTIELSKDGVGNQSTTGVSITEVDASNNAGEYEIEVNGSTGFVATAGTYVLTIYDTANPTFSWSGVYVVANGNTYTGNSAAFTATASDGRVWDGAAAIPNATVTLRRGDGTIETRVTSDSSGLWGPVYLTETVTIYAQKAGYTQATGTITVSGNTATGPGSDLTMSAVSSSASLTASALWAYARRQCHDRVGTRSDEVIKQIVNAALACVSRDSDSNFFTREQELDLRGAYTTGTLAITSGSTTVTLTGGTFPTWCGTDSVLQIGTKLHQIASRDSNTQITLSGTYRGDTVTAATYSVWKMSYDLPDDVMNVRIITYGEEWLWGDEPMSYEDFALLKHEEQLSLTGAYGFALAGGKLHLYPAPSVDKMLTYLCKIRPAALASSGDVADFPAAHIDVLYKAIDYEVCLRFGETEGKQTAADALRVYRAALTSMAGNDMDRPRRRYQPSEGRRTRRGGLISLLRFPDG